MEGLTTTKAPFIEKAQQDGQIEPRGFDRFEEFRGFGFCGPGEAREFVKGGRIEIGGELPVNTSGGLLSEGHVIGWNLFIEAVRQLRHECGERQVKDANIIQYGSFLGESVIFRR